MAIGAADKYMGEGYDLLNHNCYQLILAVKDAVNTVREENQMQADSGPRPRGGFYTNEEKNYATRRN